MEETSNAEETFNVDTPYQTILYYHYVGTGKLAAAAQIASRLSAIISNKKIEINIVTNRSNHN